MEQQRQTTARRSTATMIGLATAAFALFGSSDVSRTFSMRHFLNERYSAEYVIGENTLPRNGDMGIGTRGQRPADFNRAATGAGEAAVQNLNVYVTRPTANPTLDSNCGNPSARK